MALIELKFGGNSKREFDPAETSDLELHVRACQRRYESLDKKLSQMLVIGGALILLYLLSEPGSVTKLLVLFKDSL